MELLPTILILFSMSEVTEVEALVPHTFGKRAYSGVGEAMVSILGSSRDPRCSHILLLDEGCYLTSIVVGTLMAVRYRQTVGLFTAVETQSGNRTQQDWLAVATGQAQQLRMSLWCVTVVLVTDEPAVIAGFARLSLKNSLVVPSTRLLAITALPIRRLESIEFFHKLFSRMDAMVLTVGNSGAAIRGGVYVYLPNLSMVRGRIQLAILSSKGLTLTSHLPIFPDKYTRFLERPVLKITSDSLGKVMTKGEACGQMFINYLAQALNFTCTMLYAEGNPYGIENADGTWSGITGMLVREEADISVAAVAYLPARAQVVDYTIPILVQYSTILGILGKPELDPWSFHLPLQPYVWFGIVMNLLLLPVVLVLLSWTSYTPVTRSRPRWHEDVFKLLRVLLQQDISPSLGSWQRRVVTATWMLVALVLARSYASNLMSVLAVRYVQQPYQTLRNVLDDPGVTMIWQINSTRVQYFRSATSGIFREVAEREKAGGIKFQQSEEFIPSLDTLLRRGDHVLVSVEVITYFLVSYDFSNRGHCDFYIAKERLLPVFLSVLGQKGSPIVPQLNRRIMTMQESGLYDFWIQKTIPNSTSCAHTPSKITKSSSLSLPHLWGLMVILAGSHVAGLLLLAWEMNSAALTAS